MKHKFGGIWTRKKLEILEAYLKPYTTALKNMPFNLHYADAFAGTGSHNPTNDDGQQLIDVEDYKGSVLTALDIEPGFQQFHFNDLNSDHVASLKNIQQERLNKTIFIYEQDANTFIKDFCQRLRYNDRAVLFIDPYSTQLDWDTLKSVAQTGKIDLWLLFPISVILRMTPRNGVKIRPEWSDTLNRLLGTNSWENALYVKSEEPRMDDLFSEPSEEQIKTERVNTPELERWVTGRLRELFGYVADPVMLKNNGAPLFLFYFAVSNPSKPAVDLAQRIARGVLKKYHS